MAVTEAPADHDTKICNLSPAIIYIVNISDLGIGLVTGVT